MTPEKSILISFDEVLSNAKGFLSKRKVRMDISLPTSISLAQGTIVREPVLLPWTGRG